MSDKIVFTASEIDYDISKYFNSFGRLQAKNSELSSQIDTIIDKNDRIVMVIGGDYICSNEHTGENITNFIEAVLYPTI